MMKSMLRSVTSRVMREATSSGPGAKLARTATQAMGFVKDGLNSRHWPERPESINFEITAICDAKCIHCPRQEMERVMRSMELPLFKKMIDEAAELKVPELCPNGFGELLTMRNLHEYLEYVRTKEHDFRVAINTNGFRMTDEKIDLFFRTRVHTLNITLDGATAETFESIRPQLKLAQIEDNILRLMAQRKARKLDYPKVRVGMIVMQQNEHELPALLEKWRSRVDFVGAGGFTNRAGALDASQFATTPGPGAIAPPVPACVLPFRELNIWADGKAVLCCDDWNEEQVVGDLRQQSLKEIWHGERLRHARELHLRQRGAEIGICANCNMWRPPSKGARLWS
ncbi:MAG: radical SAM/SPASM domain-containing protein [Myxococcaceae bacterium]